MPCTSIDGKTFTALEKLRDRGFKYFVGMKYSSLGNLRYEIYGAYIKRKDAYDHLKRARETCGIFRERGLDLDERGFPLYGTMDTIDYLAKNGYRIMFNESFPELP